MGRGRCVQGVDHGPHSFPCRTRRLGRRYSHHWCFDCLAQTFIAPATLFCVSEESAKCLAVALDCPMSPSTPATLIQKGINIVLADGRQMPMSLRNPYQKAQSRQRRRPDRSGGIPELISHRDDEFGVKTAEAAKRLAGRNVRSQEAVPGPCYGSEGFASPGFAIS